MDFPMKETSGVKNPIDKTIFLNIYLLDVFVKGELSDRQSAFLLKIYIRLRVLCSVCCLK